jgi:hypothetical protein
MGGDGLFVKNDLAGSFISLVKVGAQADDEGKEAGSGS